MKTKQNETQPANFNLNLLKTSFISTLIVLSSLLFVCCSNPSSNLLSEDEQAASKARELFEKVSIKCNDSFFVFTENKLWELNGISINPDKLQISEADNLNGVTWKGLVLVHWKAMREIAGEGVNECGDWLNRSIIQEYSCERRNSEWTCTPNQGLKEKPKWNCDEISQFVSKCKSKRAVN